MNKETMFFSFVGLQKILHKKNISFLFIFLSIILFATSFVLFTIFATLENRLILILTGCIVTSIFAVTFILSLLIFLYQKKVYYQYQQILNSDGEVFIGKIIKKEDKTITLLDSFEVYIWLIGNQERQVEVYLPSWVEASYQLDEEYSFILVSRFIKGVNDHD